MSKKLIQYYKPEEKKLGRLGEFRVVCRDNKR